jgi:hypothetical protein
LGDFYKKKKSTVIAMRSIQSSRFNGRPCGCGKRLGARLRGLGRADAWVHGAN